MYIIKKYIMKNEICVMGKNPAKEDEEGLSEGVIFEQSPKGSGGGGYLKEARSRQKAQPVQRP